MNNTTNLLICIILICSCLNFINCLQQQEQKLLTDFENLAKLNNGLMNFNTQLARKYLNVPNRPYDVLALFTSSDSKHGCLICANAKSQLEKFSYSYLEYLESPSFKNKPVFLMVVEVANAMEIFQQIGVQTIPHLIYFPSGSSPISSKERLDQFDVNLFSKFLKQKTGVEIEIKLTWMEKNAWIFYLIGGAVVSIRLLIFVWRSRKNPMFWYVCSMILFSLVIGGIFYDFIHKPPFYDYNHQTGQQSYFSRGPRTQTISEGLIMGSLTVLTSVIFVYISKLPESANDAKTKSLGWFAMIAFILLLLMLSQGFQIKYYRPWFSPPHVLSFNQI